MHSFITRRPEFEDLCRPVKHVRGDGKVFWQPRNFYSKEERCFEDNLYDDLILPTIWLKEYSTCPDYFKPKLYRSRRNAFIVGCRRYAQHEKASLMEIKEVEE